MSLEAYQNEIREAEFLDREITVRMGDLIDTLARYQPPGTRQPKNIRNMGMWGMMGFFVDVYQNHHNEGVFDDMLRATRARALQKHYYEWPQIGYNTGCNTRKKIPKDILKWDDE